MEMADDVSREIRYEIDKAKKNLDQLAEALDKVATDPDLRAKLAAQPIETLTELGFEFDEDTKKDILRQLAEDTRNVEEWIGIWSASAVKSGIKSTVKAGVVTGVSSGVKSGVKSGITSVIKVAREQPEEPGEPGELEGKPPKKPATKKGAAKKK
jgi:hypothetical protein